MDYKATLNYLFEQLPVFQRTGPAAYKNNLDNTLQLDELYHHPHRNYKTIHVAGTNGKGSVSHMLASVLQAAGYKTGLYTSPHLKDFRERIKVNGEMIEEEMVVDWVRAFRTNNELWKISPSFFELTVALAFDYFAQRKVDVAVIEVGLGGRLDSTNIITPDLSIITNIGLDHTNLLGNTFEEIAAEKAGVIKKDVPVVIGTSQQETAAVFTKKAKEAGASIYFSDQEYVVNYAMLTMKGKQQLSVQATGQDVLQGLELDLLGQYQHKNIPAVLKSFEILNAKGYSITDNNIRDGLSNVIKTTGLLGRWQVLDTNPLIVCDTGHNEDGIRAIVNQLKNTAYKKLHFIIGTVGDKDPDKVLALLPLEATYYFVKAAIPRAMSAELLAEKAGKFNLEGKVFASVAEAFLYAKKQAETNDLIFVGGSTFVVAEVL
ncbi:folylpolyglutamate synthase/dihydrofolate synthase family protein [uncultured Draconibacterium sp.]|uniref:bifunctional folylpolyglutamate synthase/dihydrofolate synthase n=1 Tax=uncultured Draconibacterium sp. TaxID=1573823 RepID=UPI0025EF3951|nr:folylpolyglutamate synthase/dihydrofolate synthase family protein [uncultured Draconibacterium sp.]